MYKKWYDYIDMYLYIVYGKKNFLFYIKKN